MDQVIERLRQWGCDTACIDDRFMGDEDFYLELLALAVGDPAYENLRLALDGGQVRAAFEQAHSLKGVTGNMGLTPIYNLVCQMVEPLRRGEIAGMHELCEELMEMHKKLRELTGL